MSQISLDAQKSWVMFAPGKRRSAGSLFSLDERLEQPARRLRAQDVRQHLQRGDVLVWAGRDVIRDTNRTIIADAPQGDFALAVLRRFLGPGGVEFAGGAGDRAKIFLHQRQRLGFIKLAGNDEHNVVRLVKLFVKGPQVLDGNTLDIAAVADGLFAVVVPFVGRGFDALAEHTLR